MGNRMFEPVRTPIELLRHPVWERQINESKRAFECFSSFLALGPTRTVTGVYRQTIRGASAQASGTWNRWVTRWRWVERANAWDTHLDDERRHAQEAAARAEGERIAEERRAQRKRELDVGDKLLQRAEEMLQMPVIEVTTVRNTTTGVITQTIKPGKWRTADAARMAETAVQLRRLALDMPTSRQATVDIEPEVRELARANGWDVDATVSAALKFAADRTG